MLVVIVGEIIFLLVLIYLRRDYVGEDVMNKCLVLGGDFFFFMFKFGCWVSEKRFYGVNFKIYYLLV